MTTGIQVHKPSQWVHAVYHDMMIAGVSFAEAMRGAGGHTEWFERVITHWWGPEVAQEVLAAEIVMIEDPAPQPSSSSNPGGLITDLEENDSSSSVILVKNLSTILRA